MLNRAEKRAHEVLFPVELIIAPAEELPFGDGSFDAVVSTLVFCTVSDPSKALVEVRRVLKSGGEFRLLEHVKMKQEPVGWLQEKAAPLWKRVAGGCTFSVEGMSCGHCKAAVEGELGKLSGVEGANADPQKGTVEVAYREDQVNDEQLKGVIKEAGYRVIA